jgi:hypothetical protein
MAAFLTLSAPNPTCGQTPIADEEPGVEMLEFLGSFEDKDTGWMDPFELEALAREKGTPKEDGNGR